MHLIRYAWQMVVRDPRRTLASLLGVAIASALLVSVVLFGTASGTTVTRRALATSPVDAQAVLAPGVDRAAVMPTLAADPAVVATLPFDLVHFTGAELAKAGAATQTSAGVVVGTDPTYTATTGLFKPSSGTPVAGQVMISRDLATNLGAVPGDTVAFSLPGGGRVELKVAGIVDIAGADLVLGPTDAAHRAAGANPPVNVAVTDLATARTLADKIPAGTPAGAATAGGPVVASELAVRNEIQLRYDHTQLPGDPIAAQRWLDLVRRRMEHAATGSLTIADDAGAALESIAKDLVWGQILFLFLALPGVALALILSRFASDAAAESTRRQAALLRARGASQRSLYAVFVGAAAFTALLGAALGAVIGTLLAILLFGSELAAASPGPTIVGGIVLAVLATTLLATAAAVPALRSQLRVELISGRREVQRSSAPLWQRLYLDFIALVAGVAVFIFIGGSGVHPVLNAEGNPTVTLALTAFVAPFLIWVGTAFLLLRLADIAIRRSARLSRLLRRPLGAGGELAARSLSARPASASRTIVLLALAVSFASSVLIFDATYRQQQLVDAALTLGADLRATPTTKTDASAASAVAGPGVTAATPFVDRVVFVGSEAQDLLAINPTTLPAVAPLSDGFFQGTTASAALKNLASQPDGILVSAETAKDYSLVVGDRVRIRIPDAHGQLRDVDFRMAGVALEFPTAPKDAFLVANQSYVATKTGDPSISFVLARAAGDPRAADLATRLGSGWTVSDLGTTTARLANGVTSVDLRNLVILDVGFAELIASLGVGLFLLAGLSDRRREFATLEAIGAEPSQLRAAITGEVAVLGISGGLAGLIAGGLVAVTLLAVLAGVFDPPADVPVVPFAGLVLVLVVVVVGLAVAIGLAGQAIGRISILGALRER